jgi:hypothetical protein
METHEGLVTSVIFGWGESETIGRALVYIVQTPRAYVNKPFEVDLAGPDATVVVDGIKVASQASLNSFLGCLLCNRFHVRVFPDDKNVCTRSEWTILDPPLPDDGTSKAGRAQDLPHTREDLRRTLSDLYDRIPRILLSSDSRHILSSAVESIKANDAFADDVLTRVARGY